MEQGIQEMDVNQDNQNKLEEPLIEAQRVKKTDKKLLVNSETIENNILKQHQQVEYGHKINLSKKSNDLYKKQRNGRRTANQRYHLMETHHCTNSKSHDRFHKKDD